MKQVCTAAVMIGLSFALLAGAPYASAQQPAVTPPPAAAAPQSPPAAPSTAMPQLQQPQGDAAPRALPATGRHDLSPWSMFMSADILVKAVMVSLAFASLVTWTIFLAKTLQLFLARRRIRRALSGIADARTLSEAQLALGSAENAVSSFIQAAVREIRLSGDSGVEAGIKERAASRFSEIVKAEARAARNGMGILATIGSTAPFVGLFGTVWGIMNSFIGISKAQTTNLAVVAPGIAEALLATAIGLIAAIPAVIIYNHFTRGTRGYLDLVNYAAGNAGRMLSRDLDRAQGVGLSRAAE